MNKNTTILTTSSQERPSAFAWGYDPIETG